MAGGDRVLRGAVCCHAALRNILPGSVGAALLERVAGALIGVHGAGRIGRLGRCAVLSERERQDGRENRHILGDAHGCDSIDLDLCCSPRKRGWSSKRLGFVGREWIEVGGNKRSSRRKWLKARATTNKLRD